MRAIRSELSAALIAESQPRFAQTNIRYAALREYDLNTPPSLSLHLMSDSFLNSRCRAPFPTYSSFSRPWCRLSVW